MSYRKLVAFFIIPLIVSSAFIGCGGGKKGSPPVVTQTIYDINGKTVDQLNGSAVYTMISSQPPDKPEGNGTLSMPKYTVTLTTTAAASSNYAASNIFLKQLNSFEGQAQVDSMMRAKENQILASGRYSRSVSRFNLSRIETPISVDTTKWDVKIYNFQTKLTKTVSTTCKYISKYAYFFVDNDISTMNSLLAGYGTAFDAIYMKNHTIFGDETKTVGQEKIIIVFSRVLAETNGLLGFFNAEDKFSVTYYRDSNEGDIIYLTTASDMQKYIPATLAHEFQHMIYFDEHYRRGVTTSLIWLNEALSQAAEYYNGYDENGDNHYLWIQRFLKKDWEYGLSLTYWSDYNYGYAALFIRYLIDQYGDPAIKNMCSTDKVGIAAVEAATGTDFNTIFLNFTRALVLSNTGITSDTRYNFKLPLDLTAIQTTGRKGLATSYNYNAGDKLTGYLYPYTIFFAGWSGNFGSMTLTSDSRCGANGTVFGLNY